MKGHTLAQGLVKLHELDHVHAIWFLEQKYFADVFVHNFVVVRFAV